MQPINRFIILQVAVADAYVVPTSTVVAMLYIREAMPWLIHQAVRSATSSINTYTHYPAYMEGAITSMIGAIIDTGGDG